ncbi:glycosyltransferase [Lactococcus protaetiae]
MVFLLLGLVVSLVVLAGCSGSKSIQGTWKAQDGAGKNSTIIFTDKKVTVDGQTYNYTQNAIGTENGIKYYGIKQDGQNYTIIFPVKNKNIAIMIKPNSTDDSLKGKMLYAMNKTVQPRYNDYATKYLK